MGVVYEGEQHNLHRVVALKVIRGGRYVSEHHVKMFQREAHTHARLKHPGIAAIYASGRTDDGALLHDGAGPGRDLAAYLEKPIADGDAGPAGLRRRSRKPTSR